MVDCNLTVITDEFSNEFDEVCEFLASQEIKYVELRRVWVASIMEIEDTTLGDARDILRDNGLKVSSLASPLLKCYPPTINPHPKEKADYTKNWHYNMSKIDRLIQLADIFDCKYIRCFGYEEKFTSPPIKDWTGWPIWKEWLEAVSSMKPKLASKGKILIAENDSGFIQSLDQIEMIAKNVCSPELGLLLDPGNVAHTFGTKGIISNEWLDKYGTYTKYVHAKDVQISQTGKNSYTFVNDPQGICEWPRLIKWFKDCPSSNFKFGSPDPLFISIETHMDKENMWDNSLKSLKNLKILLSFN